MKCKNCNNDTFYYIEQNYIKCKNCKKKYSLKKLQTDTKIIKSFCDDINANECSKLLNLNYRTIKNRYDQLRLKLAKFLEEEYNKSIKDYSDYEEYYYFNAKQKQNKNKSLHDAINIMGFYFDKKVYTLLMPKLPKRNSENDEHFKEYLNWYKIHSQESYKTNLKEFWSFLEDSLRKYKGFNQDYFFYYLKECEFKFNYTKEEQIKILTKIF